MDETHCPSCDQPYNAKTLNHALDLHAAAGRCIVWQYRTGTDTPSWQVQLTNGAMVKLTGLRECALFVFGMATAAQAAERN